MKTDVQFLVESNNTFALELYSKISATEGNLCISPFSVSTALAMTFAGARGITEMQIKNVMHISLPQTEFHKVLSQLLEKINSLGQEKKAGLLLANSIYPHNKYTFLESFVTCLRENYEFNITPLDYHKPEAARNFINQWVNEKTQEHISELIPMDALDDLTRLVMVNAIYFKGLWKKQFDKRMTTESPFWVLNDFAVKVSMMRQKSQFGYMENELVQVLELPYQGDHLSQIIILPKVRMSVVENDLAITPLSKWISELRLETIDVRLPAFKIKGDFKLKDTLISMGMPDAFDMDRADFSGMDGIKYPDGLYIKHTFHQADIEVNEEGATATAATAVVMAERGLPRELEFNANHTFIFILRENTTGSILFIGRVQNPLE